MYVIENIHLVIQANRYFCITFLSVKFIINFIITVLMVGLYVTEAAGQVTERELEERLARVKGLDPSRYIKDKNTPVRLH